MWTRVSWSARKASRAHRRLSPPFPHALTLPPPPGVCEALDTVWREDEVEVEGSVLELHEILAGLDLCRLLVVKAKAQLVQSGDDGPAVVRTLLHEEVGILSGVREAEQNRAGLADEEIAHAVAGESVTNLLGLPVLKRAHTPASPAGFPHTSGGSRRSCRRRETTRRRAPACRCG